MRLPWLEGQLGFLAALSDAARAPDGAIAFAGSFGLFLAFQGALVRLGQPRLRLTRPLFGASLAVALTVCLAGSLMAWGVAPCFVPLGLAALWVSTSFGVTAGLLSFIATVTALAVVSPSMQGLDLVVFSRGVVLVLLFNSSHNNHGAWKAGLLSGCAASLMFVLLHAGAFLLIEQAPRIASEISGGLIEALAFWVSAGVGQRLLGRVSRERLVALLDLSQPLLQRMMERAPGSFEHSRAMANLAEQAASSIGADALLTRVGAYYHDLGKSVEPKFFVENLQEGEVSPHIGLAPRQSVRHILHHVTEGVRILRSAGIPEPIVEFSYTHHGKQYVEFFLNREREENPEQEPELAAFTYPGMKPSTKETAILMLVDSIEAASRTVDARDRHGLEELVRRIVFSKLAAGQLDDSGLSMSELRVLSTRVVDTLVHMNHHRIKYPWQEKKAEKSRTVAARPRDDYKTSGWDRLKVCQ